MNKDLLSLDSLRPKNRLLILKLSSDVSFVLMISSSWIRKLVFMALRFAQLMFPRSRALQRSHEWSRKYNQYGRYLLALYHARTKIDATVIHSSASAFRSRNRRLNIWAIRLNVCRVWQDTVLAFAIIILLIVAVLFLFDRLRAERKSLAEEISRRSRSER